MHSWVVFSFIYDAFGTPHIFSLSYPLPYSCSLSRSDMWIITLWSDGVGVRPNDLVKKGNTIKSLTVLLLNPNPSSSAFATLLVYKLTPRSVYKHDIRLGWSISANNLCVFVLAICFMLFLSISLSQCVPHTHTVPGASQSKSDVSFTKEWRISGSFTLHAPHTLFFRNIRLQTVIGWALYGVAVVVVGSSGRMVVLLSLHLAIPETIKETRRDNNKKLL